MEKYDTNKIGFILIILTNVQNYFERQLIRFKLLGSYSTIKTLKFVPKKLSNLMTSNMSKQFCNLNFRSLLDQNNKYSKN